jgi:uncharacterized repeat protein (TIGR01451 family)
MSCSSGFRVGGAGRGSAPCGRLFPLVAVFLLGSWLAAQGAEAQQASISRYARFTGNINVVATGGSFRTQANLGNACSVGSSSSQALAGVPAGASIVAAYLYWGGSGSTVDATVTLNGATVTASRTFQATFPLSGSSFPYFGGFADVTSRVIGDGSFTVGGLSVNTGAPHCGSEAVAAGWGLVVVYSAPGERLRAVNVFDGLQWFRGSAVTLLADGFRVPASDVDGRLAVVAWEGDPANSTALNGFSESLTVNGVALDDGINVPGSDPLLQPFDGTVNSRGVGTSWGADVDSFDVSPLLQPGQTSATAVFSAGGDLVLLTALVVSATSEPVVDLSLTKAQASDFAVGDTGNYTLRVANSAAAQREDNVVVVTDVLPAGLGFVSATGGGWGCAASGQEVTCSHPGPLDPGAALPDLTLTVSVGAAAGAGVTNTARVSSASYDTDPANDVGSAATVVRGPDLSMSIKSVEDLNGGEPDSGDTLRYTITIVETAGLAAIGVRVTDDMPADTTGFTVVSLPAGASDASGSVGAGANGTGRLDVGDIAVPAGGSATVVFDVRLAAGAAPGTTIDNIATVLNPAGPGATPAAPQLVVSPSRAPSSGTKSLYLRRGAELALSRVPGTAAEGSESIAGGGSRTWTLVPALQLPFTVRAGSIAVPLWLRRSGSGGSNRTITVTLANSVTGVVGAATRTLGLPAGATPGLFTFTIANPATASFPAGSSFRLTVAQTSGNASSFTHVHPAGPGAGAYSQVNLDSSTVINVDSVAAHDAPYPGGSSGGGFVPGATAYLRAVVSDPFGSFDISAVRVSVEDPSGTPLLSNQAMTRVADNGAATATFERPFVVPPESVAGGWTVRVVADEGTEGTVTDTGVGGFVVRGLLPALSVRKTSVVLTDPVNGAASPRRIPGSVQRYTITVTNTGPGPIDASSLVISDPIPAGSILYVGGTRGEAVEFIDGPTPSGLSFDADADVSFSGQPGGGPPYDRAPTPDAEGFDPAITGIRIAPGGSMNGGAPSSPPSFGLRFRVRLR